MALTGGKLLKNVISPTMPCTFLHRCIGTEKIPINLGRGAHYTSTFTTHFIVQSISADYVFALKMSNASWGYPTINYGMYIVYTWS